MLKYPIPTLPFPSISIRFTPSFASSFASSSSSSSPLLPHHFFFFPSKYSIIFSLTPFFNIVSIPTLKFPAYSHLEPIIIF